MTKEDSLVSEGWKVSDSISTLFTNSNGIYQDGGLALCRDKVGTLWGLFGHSYLGGVSLWKGLHVHTMEKVCDIGYNFKLGKAGEAFEGIPYPDGPRSRGGIWPYGLWIDPEDGRFYCFIHNETGWGGKETSYNAFGKNEGEPDFRHIGLMTSDDSGNSWDFRGWIITSEKPCWTTVYRPGDMVGGQVGKEICLGAGDFTLLVNHRDEFMYIFYTQITFDVETKGCHDAVYAARAPISSKGLPGSWKKLFGESFSEAGNMGRETVVLEKANVPSISYNTFIEKYIMSSYRRECWISGMGACQISMSSDLISWSRPKLLDGSRKDLSKPYFTICNVEDSLVSNETGKTFRLFMESNGTDVEEVQVTISSLENEKEIKAEQMRFLNGL